MSRDDVGGSKGYVFLVDKLSESIESRAGMWDARGGTMVNARIGGSTTVGDGDDISPGRHLRTIKYRRQGCCEGRLDDEKGW